MDFVSTSYHCLQLKLRGFPKSISQFGNEIVEAVPCIYTWNDFTVSIFGVHLILDCYPLSGDSGGRIV